MAPRSSPVKRSISFMRPVKRRMRQEALDNTQLTSLSCSNHYQQLNPMLSTAAHYHSLQWLTNQQAPQRTAVIRIQHLHSSIHSRSRICPWHLPVGLWHQVPR